MVIVLQHIERLRLLSIYLAPLRFDDMVLSLALLDMTLFHGQLGVQELIFTCQQHCFGIWINMILVFFVDEASVIKLGISY